MSYKRILLKLSGEQLSGKFEVGIDPEIASYVAQEIIDAKQAGTEFVVVVGGGNMVRGAEVAGHGIRRVTADHMGMLSGLMNAIALTDIFEARGIVTRCLSNLFTDQVAEAYSFRRADKHLEQSRVVIVAGGLGRPYFTHDVAAVNVALELDCNVTLKATKVDGVYDKDPIKHTDAKRFNSLDYQTAVENPHIKVMDKAALGLAMEHGMPVIVFDIMEPGNLKRLAAGEAVGTKIS
ncbi:UMP kinase [Candidatus Saccharibacteria bacterium]|nr:UMP kinase [Candidatus Saccharibacteria bacterium]